MLSLSANNDRVALVRSRRCFRLSPSRVSLALDTILPSALAAVGQSAGAYAGRTMVGLDGPWSLGCEHAYVPTSSDGSATRCAVADACAGRDARRDRLAGGRRTVDVDLSPGASRRTDDAGRFGRALLLRHRRRHP